MPSARASLAAIPQLLKTANKSLQNVLEELKNLHWASDAATLILLHISRKRRVLKIKCWKSSFFFGRCVNIPTPLRSSSFQFRDIGTTNDYSLCSISNEVTKWNSDNPKARKNVVFPKSYVFWKSCIFFVPSAQNECVFSQLRSIWSREILQNFVQRFLMLFPCAL